MCFHVLKWVDDPASVSLHVCERERRCGRVPRPGVHVWAPGGTCFQAEPPCPRPHTQHEVALTADATHHTEGAAGSGGRSVCVKDPSALPLRSPARGQLCCVGPLGSMQGAEPGRDGGV